MEITNLSFKTDGKTIGVPSEKGKGRFKIADSRDFKENLGEYMLYCQAYKGGKEIGMDITD